MNKESVKRDLEEYKRLSQENYKLIEQVKEGIRKSEREGNLFHYDYDPQTYHARTYGTEVQKADWWKKRQELVDSLFTQERVQIKKLEAALKVIEERYSDIIDCAYNMYGEASQFEDFLKVVLNTLVVLENEKGSR